MNIAVLRRLKGWGDRFPAPSIKTPQTLQSIRFSGILMSALLMFGCSSTAITTYPDGRVLEIRSGFGNRINTPEVVVEPSPVVVEAGERLGREVVLRASDSIMQQAVQNATQQN